MTALPSFVQLMASLGLENSKQPSAETQPAEFANSSPSIVVSEHDSDQDRHTARRVTRYAPYSAPISHTRRRSSSSLSEGDFERPDRSSSASPRLSTRVHRPVALKLGAESRHRHSHSETEMPISTFVRRRTPQSSPISPTFAHRARNNRKRSTSPKLPVSIPTLPPVFPKRSATPEDRSSSPYRVEEDTHLTPDYPEDRRGSLSLIREEDHRRYIPPIA